MNNDFSKLISLGALVALGGYVLSGPVAFLLVNTISPQPAWVSPAVFAHHYSVIQDLPFYFGFFLLGGMLMLVAGHYLNYKEGNTMTKFHLLVSLGWTIVFCGLISFNYIGQTTFVHNLAVHYRPEYDSAIAMFSMSNPMSFCWANEMWGYAILGIATLLMAGYYRNKSNVIRGLLIANGVISMMSALWTIVDVSWVMSPFGLVAYFTWNVLMILMMILIYKHSKIVPVRNTNNHRQFSHIRQSMSNSL
ncbi:MAG: hypothetical protein IPP15_22825 [Saprospiraceae bacterium]|uniref:Uncharacterized protein n=1 Tax=Candidatus Opimibacter skivensis TaxID=2982028 RepID=A0A9D7SZH4_9BACT|nr:hypothetical protein [Candidatus Opimibacter skivensis]